MHRWAELTLQFARVANLTIALLKEKKHVLLQVDVPGWPEPVHPDQLLLRLRRRAHWSQYLRGGGPGHRSVKTLNTALLGFQDVQCLILLPSRFLWLQAQTLTTSGSSGAPPGRGIAPSRCYPATFPKRPVPTCASPIVDCSAFSWVRACSGSESEPRRQLCPGSMCLHFCTLVRSICCRSEFIYKH